MAVYSADAYAWSPSWNALWSQRWGDYYDDQQNYPTAILLRHPTAPYEAVVPKIDDDHLRCVSYKYLIAANSLEAPHINRPLKIPPELLKALAPPPNTDVFASRWPRTRGASDGCGSDGRFIRPTPIHESPLKFKRWCLFKCCGRTCRMGSTLPDLTVVMLATRFIDGFSIALWI